MIAGAVGSKWHSTQKGHGTDCHSDSSDYPKLWLKHFFRHFQQVASEKETGLAGTYYVVTTIQPIDISDFDSLTSIVNPEPFTDRSGDNLYGDDASFDFEAEDLKGAS